LIQGAKKNEEDAKELALYIANLSGTIATALQKRGVVGVTDDMTRGVNDFTE
jgi:hypothetical protein